MIIYMLLNEVTEKVYIGKSINSAEYRFAGHMESSKSGSTSRFHQELKTWPEECWTMTILQHCYSEEELAIAEGNWISVTDATNPAIGYNTHYVPSSDDIALTALASIRKGRRDTEFFAACGRKGAAKAKRRADMTPEEIERFREWGRKGAARSKEARLSRADLLRPRPVGTTLDRVNPMRHAIARTRGLDGGTRRQSISEPLGHRDSNTSADRRLHSVALLLGVRVGVHDLVITQREKIHTR